MWRNGAAQTSEPGDQDGQDADWNPATVHMDDIEVFRALKKEGAGTQEVADRVHPDAIVDKALVIWKVLQGAAGRLKRQAFNGRARRGAGYDGRAEAARWPAGRRVETAQ